MSAGAQGHESGAQEEIAKIMSEIDDLRKEMEEASENVNSDAMAPEVEASFDEPSETDASPALGAVAEAASAAAEAMAGTSQSTGPAALGVTDASAEDEDDILRSGSQRGSQEPSLEETLGDLEEEEAQGDSLLSQSITTTAVTPDAHDKDANEENPEDDGGQSLTQQLKPEFERAKNAVPRESSRLRSMPVGPVPPVATHSGHGSLTLQVSGNLQLKLQFEAGAREVTLQIEDETFVVRMSDGTEFRMPMVPASSTGKLRVV